MQIFMLRSRPHKIERIDIFLKENVVGIGWVDTKDLTGATLEDIRKALESLGYENQSLRTNLGMVNSFIRTMQQGDIVLVREGDFVHIGELGSYQWRQDYVDKYMGHTRPVSWITKVPFKEFNASVQSLLKNIKTIAQYKGSFEESELGKYIEGTFGKGIQIQDKEQLLANTIESLRDLMNNAKDETVRLEATKELLKYIK
ncbi:hypothetical protein CON21_30815 [Bacillus thuringiensis]|uniref:hypothetical protein n=1 Tax=Bacillus thuringiensis TaxID=1428 RepID=UPI000BEB815A|nr:hypothetical protein [Bacillus thuringiensis]PEE96969.1 hypothetical protein CON21_30815 [Bacillus thuringiensis]